MNITPLKVTVREVVTGYVDDSDREEGIYGYSGRLNIRPKYQRNYIYDDAGAYYANMTLFHTGRGGGRFAAFHGQGHDPAYSRADVVVQGQWRFRDHHARAE